MASNRSTAGAPVRREPSAKPVRKPRSGGVRRRQQILDIAAKLFAEFGYEETTIRLIGEHASILSGSIYYHFESKDDILDCIIREPLDFVGDNSSRILESGGSPVVKLAALVILILRGYERDPDAHKIVFNERTMLRHNPRFKYTSEAKHKMYFAWSEVAKAGIAEGVFDPAIDTFLMMSSIIRMLNTSALWLFHERVFDVRDTSRYTLDDIIDFNLDTVLQMMLAHAGKHDAQPREAAELLLGQVARD